MKKDFFFRACCKLSEYNVIFCYINDIFVGKKVILLCPCFGQRVEYNGLLLGKEKCRNKLYKLLLAYLITLMKELLLGEETMNINLPKLYTEIFD